MDLSAAELRVLGCLVEKQLTTPQQYPLTLNALTLACSQSTNRHPVVAYDEAGVEDAVTSVKTKGLARFVHPSHGRSALRYAHALDEALGLDTPPLALLALLVLRGPQTVGELRTRSERMVRFSGLDEVQAELDALADRSEPLVVCLGRNPGQKEVRYAQLLGASALDTPPRPDTTSPRPRPAAPADRPDAPADHDDAPADHDDAPADHEDVAALRAEVAALRSEVESLRRGLDHLRRELGA